MSYLKLLEKSSYVRPGTNYYVAPSSSWVTYMKLHIEANIQNKDKITYNYLSDGYLYYSVFVWKVGQSDKIYLILWNTTVCYFTRSYALGSGSKPERKSVTIPL